MLLLLTERNLSFKIQMFFSDKEKVHLSAKRMIIWASDRKVAMICDCFWFRRMLDPHASFLEVAIEWGGPARVVDHVWSLWIFRRGKGSPGWRVYLWSLPLPAAALWGTQFRFVRPQTLWWFQGGCVLKPVVTRAHSFQLRFIPESANILEYSSECSIYTDILCIASLLSRSFASHPT